MSKEMNIEESIKLAKNFTKMDFSNPMGWTGYYDTELKELSQAIETVLKEYERVKNGRNFLFESITAKAYSPEMLDKVLRQKYISKEKSKEIFQKARNKVFSKTIISQRDAEYLDNLVKIIKSTYM